MQISDRISEKTNDFFLAFFEYWLNSLISVVYENMGLFGEEKRFV
jgi:hypothetical protein